MNRTLCALFVCLYVAVAYGQNIGFLIPQLQSDNAFGRRRNIFNLQSAFSVDGRRPPGFHNRGYRTGYGNRYSYPYYDEVIYVSEPDAEENSQNSNIRVEEGSSSLPVPIGNDDQVFVFSDTDNGKPRNEAVVTADKSGNNQVLGDTPVVGNERNVLNTSENGSDPPSGNVPELNKSVSMNKEVEIPDDPTSDSIKFEEDTSTSTKLPELSPVPNTENRNSFGRAIFQETCTTAGGGVGGCIVLTSCESLYSRLKENPSDKAVVSELRTAHCGFQGTEPKVCCPKEGLSETIPTAPPQTSPAPEVPTTTSDGKDYLPEPPECGFSNASFSRVVGGVAAKLGDFPWMALLGYRARRAGDGPRWLCGGALVARRHVLTAAHCIHKHERDLYIVRLGELDVSRDDDGATPVDIAIARADKHEDYNPTAFTDDIGLLLLEREVQYTDLIRPICLPSAAELRARSFENYTPIIAGWGDTEFRGPAAPHLQALQLPVVSNEFCAEAYSAYKSQHIDERVLCAGYKRGGRDACQGDSGGPLMQPIWSQETYKTYFYQIGVVSFGKKCAEAGFPGVYTRVTHFVPWLQKKITGKTAD